MSYNPNPQRFRDLSVPRQRLINLMRDEPFCEIRDLHVVGGEPLFAPPPRVIRHVKFGAASARHGGADLDGLFVLKPEVLELICQFTWAGHALVHSLVVKHGLPFTMSIEAGH
jgi:hypothetical protein